MISIIAAVGKNNELGKDNRLIWNIPNDMKFFKNTTMGHKVIMGRKTYESLPSSGLPGREMIVLSSVNFNNDVQTFENIDDILQRYLNIEEEIFIIGGASVYSQFIQYADIMYLTEIDDFCKTADTFFPIIDNSEWYKEIIENGSYGDVDYQICKYIRKKQRKII